MYSERKKDGWGRRDSLAKLQIILDRNVIMKYFLQSKVT